MTFKLNVYINTVDFKILNDCAQLLCQCIHQLCFGTYQFSSKLLLQTSGHLLWYGFTTSAHMARHGHFDGLVQDCSISIANALEILHSCTKPSIWCWVQVISVCVQVGDTYLTFILLHINSLLCIFYFSQLLCQDSICSIKPCTMGYSILYWTIWFWNIYIHKLIVP